MSQASFAQSRDRVNAFSLARLREALNPATGLFDRQLRDRKWDATLGTEDMTGTAICLIGIHRWGGAESVGLDPRRTCESLFQVSRRRMYAGGAGLVLWANAVWNGIAYPEAMRALGLGGVDPQVLPRSLTTMEVAWLVSGLLHEVRRSHDTGAGLLLDGALAELTRRFRPDAGLVDHCSSGAPALDRVRLWVPNFADQVYSLQAFSFAARERSSPENLSNAAAIAVRLVNLQGESGQWWWHYDTRTGGVAQPYPVYAVHQHGMAPMALRALEAAGGPLHEKALRLSKAWLTANEIGAELIDETAGTIWRDIEYTEGRLSSLVRQARSVLGVPGGRTSGPPPALHVNYETRPYEWAWCLYAAAIESGKANGGHVV
jgi:hypothetical protein